MARAPAPQLQFNPEGVEIASRMDAAIAKPSGLEWCNCLSRSRGVSLRVLRKDAGTGRVDWAASTLEQSWKR